MYLSSSNAMIFLSDVHDTIDDILEYIHVCVRYIHVLKKYLNAEIGRNFERVLKVRFIFE